MDDQERRLEALNLAVQAILKGSDHIGVEADTLAKRSLIVAARFDAFIGDGEVSGWKLVKDDDDDRR